MREFLEDLWRDLAGLPPKEKPKKLPPIEELRKSEWCAEYEQYCRNRLVMGAFRYGLIAKQDFSKYDLLQEVKRRIDRFKSSGNLEDLVDAGNMCQLAYIHFKRQGYKFHAKDDGEHTKEVCTNQQ